jgi:hypothetical protein
LGTNIGEVESLKLFNSQAASTEILAGTSLSVLRMYLNILSVSTNNVSIAAIDNSKATFNVNTAKNWSITSNQNWLSMSSTSGSGNSTITLTAQANVFAEKRSATLIISDTGSNSQVVTVTQDGATPVLTVSTNTLTVGALQGSTTSVDIASNMNWAAASSQSWLTANSQNGSGNSTLTLTASSNPTITTRTATLTISGTGITPVIITITQSAGAASLYVSSNSIELAAQANSTRSFVIYSNIDWTATSDQSWLTLNPISGSNSATITLTAQANQSTESRNATITVSGNNVTPQTILISQDPGIPALTVSTSSVTITNNNTATFDIHSNTNWSVMSNQSWLTVSPGSGNGNATLILTAQSNFTTITRAASLIITGTGVSPLAVTVLQNMPNGINEIDESMLYIYPNPSTTEITVNNISIGTAISIYDLKGKLLISKASTSTAEMIDISMLANGFYTVVLRDNLMTKTLKFIKQ